MSDLLPASPTDNSISVLAKHDTFRRQKQEMYYLPIIVTDNGHPPLSSTNTLTIRVCGCSKEGVVQSCNVEAYVLPIGLSMGALIAILACIILLLGEPELWADMWRNRPPENKPPASEAPVLSVKRLWELTWGFLNDRM